MIVIVGYDTELNYNKLRVTCELINQGIPYILTHPDTSYPGQKGPIPDAGAISTLIKITTKKEPICVFGKPKSLMLQSVFDSKRIVEESIFIGDRLYTDKVLADNLNMDFICTLTGEASLEQIQELDYDRWPTFIIKSVLDLHVQINTENKLALRKQADNVSSS